MTHRKLAAHIAAATVAGKRDLLRLMLTRTDHITVASAARKMGVDAAWLKRWSSALGRRAAKNHRLATGTEPATKWEIDRRGKVGSFMAYPVGSLALLEALAFYAQKTGLAG